MTTIWSSSNAGISISISLEILVNKAIEAGGEKYLPLATIDGIFRWIAYVAVCTNEQKEKKKNI